MIYDKSLMFSEAQTLAFAAGAADSTNIIDLGAARGAYEGNFLSIRLTEAVTSLGSATVQFDLITDSAVGFATAPVTLWSSGAVAKAALVVGKKFEFALPHGCKRYLKLVYTVAVATTTAGKATSGIVSAIDLK